MTIIERSSLALGRPSQRAAGSRVALLAACFALGCANANAAPGEEAAAVGPAPVQLATAEQAPPVYKDFAEFWRHFRNGLLQPDIAGLARLTTFPVSTRGRSDNDPEGSVERALFSQLIRRLLAQDVGESEKPETLAEYLKRNEKAPANAVTGPTARVTHLQFALDANGWRFVGAYLSD